MLCISSCSLFFGEEFVTSYKHNLYFEYFLLAKRRYLPVTVVYICLYLA